MRCVGFSGMLLSFVTTLQDDYKRWSKHEMRCIGFSWDATIFCNNFARWLQKIIATCDAMCWDALIFCNNFARWLQKIIATCDAMCWFFWDAMIFCNNFVRLCSPNEDFQKPKNISDRRFEHFFKGLSTRFGLRLLEKSGRKCFSVFENLRLGTQWGA